MIKKYYLLFILLLCTDVNSSVSDLTLKDEKVDKRILDSWSLNADEYRRYLFLKNNTPRGYYSKDHPIFYLGIEARNDEERKKYAKIIAQMEFENFEKIQAFSKEIQKQSLALYGNGDILDLNSLKIDPINKALNSNKKPMVFISYLYVTKNCFDDCKVALDKEVNRLRAGDSKQLHVIFPKDHSEKDINKWAYINNVPVNLNNKNLIILRSIRKGDDENIDKFPTVASQLL